MSSPLLAVLAVLSAASTASSAASIRYDQTQTGGTNVHLQIKNVEVLALLDDAGSEYDYDYSDFTVKPPKPGASSNTTNSTSTTTLSPASADSSNSTVTPSSAQPEEPLVSSSAATPAAAVDESNSEGASTAPTRTRRCGAGFYRDTLGRCRRIRRPHLQMMVNLARTKTTESPLPS